MNWDKPSYEPLSKLIIKKLCNRNSRMSGTTVLLTKQVIPLSLLERIMNWVEPTYELFNKSIIKKLCDRNCEGAGQPSCWRNRLFLCPRSKGWVKSTYEPFSKRIITKLCDRNWQMSGTTVLLTKQVIPRS